MYNKLQSHVGVGMEVRTRDGKPLGRITTLHGDTFEVEKGFFFKRDYCASFNEIQRIDASGIVLTSSEREIKAMRANGGLGTSLGERAAGVVDHARAALGNAVDAVHPPHSDGR